MKFSFNLYSVFVAVDAIITTTRQQVEKRRIKRDASAVTHVCFNVKPFSRGLVVAVSSSRSPSTNTNPHISIFLLPVIVRAAAAV